MGVERTSAIAFILVMLQIWGVWRALSPSEKHVELVVKNRVIKDKNKMQPFVFTYPPKTGPTSAEKYMEELMRTACSQAILDDPVSHAAAVEEFSWRSKKTPQVVARGAKIIAKPPSANCLFTHVKTGPNFEGAEKAFNLVMEDGVRLKMVMGPVPHGFCFLVEQGCQYVTVLTEPVARLMAEYQHMESHDPALLNTLCRGHLCTTFSAFVDVMLGFGTKGPWAFDNLMTRMIAGDGRMAALTGFGACIALTQSCDIARPGAVNEKMLELAESNLKQYAVVGVTEHMYLFHKALEEAFYFPPHNASSELLPTFGAGTTLDHGLSPAQYKALCHAQRHDIALYNIAKKMALAPYQ